MDHLPYPNLGVPPIVVPYLSGFDYDGGDFATFPERVGFWKDGTFDLDRPCRELAALAQAWLFFGLIDVFTGRRLDRNVLLRKEDSNRADESVVDTTALGGIVEESIKRQVRPLLSSELLKRIRAQLMEAARASSTLDRIQAGDSLSAAVFLSVKLLITYLSVRIEPEFGLHFGPRLLSILSLDSILPPILERKGSNGNIPAPARLLMNRMQQSGWCIHQIMEIFRANDYCIVYYYSSIPRVESWDDITHEACTEAHCIAYNIKDNSAYRIRHTEHCPGCELVGPSEDEVAHIVRHGNIPLVELNAASLENQTQLRVRPATPYSRYTAISHVWIDGHGNPTANTLPRCQLRRLEAWLSTISNAQHSWVDRLWNRLRDPPPTSHLLWMDTLCIPAQRHSEDQKFLRKKSINRMALIYVGAEQVLVLDAELDKFTLKSCPCELKDALISCSRWNGRCWTLEEGALARKCLFQFRDALIEATPYDGSTPRAIMRFVKYPWSVATTTFRYRMDRVFLRTIRDECPQPKIPPDFAHDYLRRKLAEAALQSAQIDISRAWYAIDRKAPGRDLQVRKFVRTWNDVGRRSTTRPEDIHPIMANLTDFSAAQIMGLETPVLRTKMIAHCIGQFPLDVLWTPCARPQANQDSADRWIPSIPGPEPLVEQVRLSSTSKGLVLDAGDYLKPPESFWIPQGMAAPRFCFRWPHDDRGELWYVVKCIISEDDALLRSASQTACLILSPEAASWSVKAAPLVLRGARLLVTKGNSEMAEPLYLRYDCPLICTIQMHPPDFEQIQDTVIMTVNKVSRSRMLVIESTFDPKDRERFNMRSRDFYHGYRMAFVDIIIVWSGIAPGIMLAAFVLLGWKSTVSDLPIGAIPPVAVAVAAVSFGLCYPFVILIRRWKHARAYNAWKATFEEDWTPRDSFVRRFTKAVCLPRHRKRTDHEEELVNV